MSRDVHFVWNMSAAYSLRKAVGDDDAVVVFGDDPSLGPVGNEALREEFFRQFYVKCGLSEPEDMPEKAIFSPQELKEIIKDKNGKRVVIWTSNCGNDHIFLRMCVWYMQNAGVDIWCVKVPPLDKILEPFASVARFSPEKLRPLIKTAVQLDRYAKNQLKVEFEGYISNPSPLRILEASGSISFYELSHFDQHLLAECSLSWQKAARVIAGAMGYFYPQNPMGDLIFLFRLRALIDAGQIDARGDVERGMQHFEVRHRQNN
ncbi:hypothetical protein MNBD_ALPHA11-1962 [hydrothermal vent metagenome]|uniref:DUF1835 domain-containing protein n=1 Tax=hydrothermal vent metagenome TaxID=652676 RepID=A0A3B0U3W7_9ZZZZ